MANVISVNCNNCGASLEVDEATRFVTCAHCGSKLEIRRGSGSVFTQTLERIEHATASASKDLEIIRLEQELERLDREWQMQHPGMPLPSSQNAGNAAIGSVVGGAFLALWVFGCFAMSAMAAKDGAPVFFSIMTAGMGLVGLIGGGAAIAKSLSGGREGPAGGDSFAARRQAILDQIVSRRSQT